MLVIKGFPNNRWRWFRWSNLTCRPWFTLSSDCEDHWSQETDQATVLHQKWCRYRCDAESGKWHFKI